MRKKERKKRIDEITKITNSLKKEKISGLILFDTNFKEFKTKSEDL